MVVKREAITERLKALDTTLEELRHHQDLAWEDFSTTLREQWIVERGLIAGAAIIFDIADHILAAHFGHYAATYEDSLAELRARGVISEALYQQIKGLGGFRNILVHRYLQIDAEQTFDNFHKALSVFPQFGLEILTWLAATASEP